MGTVQVFEWVPACIYIYLPRCRYIMTIGHYRAILLYCLIVLMYEQWNDNDRSLLWPPHLVNTLIILLLILVQLWRLCMCVRTCVYLMDEGERARD